jgi:hypothetical protein
MEIEDREISDESDEEPDEAPSPPPGFGPANLVFLFAVSGPA